jgi:hypothetical protein
MGIEEKGVNKGPKTTNLDAPNPIGGMGRLNEFQIAMAKNLFDEEPFDADWYED